MKKIQLGDLITVDSGYAFKSNLFNNDMEGIPLIRIRDISSGEISTYYSGEYDEKYIVNNGDLLIGMDGSFNIRKWNSGKALLNQRVCRVKSNNINYLLDDYIYRILPLELKKIEDKTSFVTVKHLSVKDINQIEISLPNIRVQQNIIHLLDKAESLIYKRKEQIEALDELVKSKFIEMFGEPVKNPKNFDEKKVRNISTYLKRGTSPKYVEKSDIKVINQKCIYWRELKRENCKYYDEEFRNKVENIFLRQGDILINSTGTGTLGRAMNFNINDNSKYIADSHVTVLRTIKEYINPIFFTNLFEFRNIQDTIYRKCVNGSTNQIELSVGKLGDYLIMVPPIEIQNQFAAFVKQVDEMKSKMENSLKELEDNFNSLMQKAFKGELF